MGITLGVAEKNNPGVEEGSGMILSGWSFGDTWIGSLQSSGPGEGDTLGNSEGIRFGSKLGISDGELMCITLGVVDRRKLGGDK